MALDADEIIELLYQHEIERRSKTYDRIGTPIGVLAVLGGIFSFYGTRLFGMKELALGGPLVFFLVLIVPAVLLFVTAIVYLRRSIRRHVFERLIPPAASYFREQAEALTGEENEAIFHQRARRIFSDFQVLLRQANSDRQRWLHRTYDALFWGVVFTTAAGIPFLLLIMNETS